MIRKTFAEIHLQNLRHNYRVLKKLQDKQSFFCPMVKSSAYGHGDSQSVKALIDEGCKTFGVALIEEAQDLRESGVSTEDILVFGPFGKEAISTVRELNLTPVVSVMEQLQALVESRYELNIHIKLNTGMNRLGFDKKEWENLLIVLNNNPQIKIVGICSHLAIAEDYFDENSFSSYQIKEFKEGLKHFSIQANQAHLFNSAGLIAHSMSPTLSWGARPGIALYGVKPHLHNLSQKQKNIWNNLNLKPVMTLKSEVIAYHNLKKGEKVSYGGRWVAPRNSIIGVIPIGYADGFHRLFSQQGIIMYRGKTAPVVGTVCMDYTMVDLTDILTTTSGNWKEEVILFGESNNTILAVEEVAKRASTISYELLTSVSKRVPRIYVK
ncbi:MAG: alanine racemase [Bdellovibrionaceae bacterium]|nr:alanine racemase [Pseudobdellovibrionaceae bacterium]